MVVTEVVRHRDRQGKNEENHQLEAGYIAIPAKCNRQHGQWAENRRRSMEDDGFRSNVGSMSHGSWIRDSSTTWSRPEQELVGQEKLTLASRMVAKYDEVE